MSLSSVVSNVVLRQSFLQSVATVATAFLLISAVSAQSAPFLTTVTYDAGSHCPNSIAVADINADGKPDVIVAGGCVDINGQPEPGSISVLLGNGDGTFKPVVNYHIGGVDAGSLNIVDINGDGKADLVVVNGVVSVLLGNGDGTFQAPTIAYNSGFGSLTVADVNGDGKVDLVVTSEFSVGVLLGNGDGTFRPVVSYGSGGVQPDSAVVADVNHDGKPDIVVANTCSDDFCTIALVGVLLGNGDGTFRPVVTYASGGDIAMSIAVADANGDGKPDILVLNAKFNADDGSTGSVGVLLGNGDGTFEPAVTYATGAPDATSLAVGDLNGDGKVDLAVSHCTAQEGNHSSCPGTLGVVGTLLGNGDGTFQTVVKHTSGGVWANSIAIADVNNDRQPDIVVANRYGESNGDGTVGLLLHNSKSTHPTSIVISSSLNPSFYGQAVTLTATVTSKQGVIPNGETVTFFNNEYAIGTATTVAGAASLTTASLPVKINRIRATYSGDAKFQSSTTTLLQTVNKYPTATTLASTPNPSTHGQAVIFTATVKSQGPNPPAGHVRFVDGTTGIGSANLVNGVATLVKSTLSVGTHRITAEYKGDGSSEQSTSAVLKQVVQ